MIGLIIGTVTLESKKKKKRDREREREETLLFGKTPQTT